MINLTPEERAEFDSWLEHHRVSTLKQMAESAVVLNLVPNEINTTGDMEYALQLGLSLLLDKPILVVCMPGRQVPRRLEQVADEIVYADLDTEKGREAISEAIARL